MARWQGTLLLARRSVERARASAEAAAAVGARGLGRLGVRAQEVRGLGRREGAGGRARLGLRGGRARGRCCVASVGRGVDLRACRVPTLGARKVSAGRRAAAAVVTVGRGRLKKGTERVSSLTLSAASCAPAADSEPTAGGGPGSGGADSDWSRPSPLSPPYACCGARKQGTEETASILVA